eukprot:Em0081g10a
MRACYAGARCRLAHCSSANASRGLTWCQRTETLVTIIPAGWSRGFSSGAEATVTGSVPEVVSSTQIGLLPQTTATITAAELAASPLPDVLALETSNQARWMADAVSSAADHLPAQGDLASMGLGGYGPVGILQTALDVLHTHTSLPWWAAIAASTVILRLALFPLGVRLQANSVRLNNVRPEAEAIMQKVREHNQAGNTALASQQTARLYSLYQQHKCNPFKMMVMPLVQLPIFISFFVAIREMASVPIESMKTGGMLWFMDLTVSDPYYVLPVLSCLSFMATIELGGETGVTNPQTEKMKVFFRAMAILLIPVTATFPSGLFMYWLTSSAFSLSQILLLKLPSFRTVLGIPPLVRHPTQTPFTPDGTKQGMFSTIKESYRSAVLIDQARKKEQVAKQEYQKLLKNPNIKLYDKPPHKRLAEQ